MSQHKDRLSIINMLYRHFLLNNQIEVTKQEAFDFSQSVQTVASSERLSNLLDNIQNIIYTINHNLKQGWDFSRLSNFHKAVLSYSVYELLYLYTPKAVVINEALDILKRYGEDEDISYINAILDKISKISTLNNENSEVG